ncbi:hypothetical protein [Streptomyces albipurpureus]|uniref:Uncharacterized protein n=1 Tax=Streptomyces albipurpureus TaxID=2897419 RepID=A0ABT0UGE7_9ACTN|nr:hypothetical protein [Streptomyces sp. CWNU-1]MCM2387498.1 hypothetical protein [Streptomyces sp. CWNU-1]
MAQAGIEGNAQGDTLTVAGNNTSTLNGGLGTCSVGSGTLPVNCEN